MLFFRFSKKRLFCGEKTVKQKSVCFVLSSCKKVATSVKKCLKCIIMVKKQHTLTYNEIDERFENYIFYICLFVCLFLFARQTVLVLFEWVVATTFE